MAYLGRVLVIDDSWPVLEAIRASLATEGYEVLVASDLAGAARHIHRVDMCVIDFHMPGLDGRSVMVALKAALGRDHNVAFYLYTSDAEVARRHREHGFDGSFMRKGDATLLRYQVAAVFRSLRLAQVASAQIRR